MPLLAPSPRYGYHLTNDSSPASTTTYGTLVTASGTAHVKGSWVAIHSSIAHDLYWHMVTFTAVLTAASTPQMLVDLGVGPDSSNVSVVAENLLAGLAANWGASVSGGAGRQYWMPLYVPAGTQLWARCQASVVSDTVRVAIHSHGGGIPTRGLGGLVTYIQAIGADTATSAGTAFTPGNGVMGSYAQLTASSANEYVGLMASYTSGDTTSTADGNVIELGIGAATEEDLGQVCQATIGADEAINHIAWPRFQLIPAGTRIAVRGAAVSAVDTTQTAVAYGLMGVSR